MQTAARILTCTAHNSTTYPEQCSRDRFVWRLALGEEELDGVLGEGERHDGDGAGPHNQTLGPQPGQVAVFSVL